MITTILDASFRWHDMHIERAVDLLRAGQLVAFPTETVYGLGADASNRGAVEAIFRAKQRPYNHPLIVHLGLLEQLKDWAMDISEAALTLAHHFWPGPLTMLLKKQPTVLEIVTGGQATIGIRIPKHPVAHALLRAFEGGIAAPSANKFTRISPTNAKAVQEELGNRVPLILDGGESDVGLESTIIDMSQEQPVLLRPGMISLQAMEQVLGMKIIPKALGDVPRAPGMYYRHYAPQTTTQYLTMDAICTMFAKIKGNELPIVFLIHSELNFPQLEDVDVIKMPILPHLYARTLYQTLRMLDKGRYKSILIEEVPPKAEWDAIKDRLIKATASK